MGGLAAILPVVGTIATVGSAAFGIYNSVQQGQAQQAAANQTALNLQNQGKAEFASSQRDVLQKDLETKYLLSTQQAQAAASGGGAGADAPTIVRMMSETAKRGADADESILYGGYSSKASYDNQADAVRQSGGNAFLGGIGSGIGKVISAAGEYARGKQQGYLA